MASVYDTVDLYWLWNGDYDIDKGDIRDTNEDHLQSLAQEVQDIAASALNDWANYPQKGATLDDFIGEPNSRRTGDSIHDRLRLALISAGIVRDQDLRIRVVPVHIYKILIVVMIDAVPTAFNKLNRQDKVAVHLVFDFLERGVFFLESAPKLLGG